MKFWNIHQMFFLVFCMMLTCDWHKVTKPFLFLQGDHKLKVGAVALMLFLANVVKDEMCVDWCSFQYEQSFSLTVVKVDDVITMMVFLLPFAY